MRFGREGRSRVGKFRPNRTPRQHWMRDDTDRRTDDPRLGRRKNPCCRNATTAGVPRRLGRPVGLTPRRFAHRRWGGGLSLVTGRGTSGCCFPAAAAATSAACRLPATTAASLRTNQFRQHVRQTALRAAHGGRREFAARRFRVRPVSARHRQTEQPEHKTDQHAAAHNPSAELSPVGKGTPGRAGQSMPNGVKRQTHGNAHGEANGGQSFSITDSQPSGPPGSDGRPPCIGHHIRRHGTSQRWLFSDSGLLRYSRYVNARRPGLDEATREKPPSIFRRAVRASRADGRQQLSIRL